MSKLSLLKMAPKYLAHRFRSIHPVEVEACLLNTCNLNCIYCRCTTLTSAQLTTKEWKTIIRGFAALGTLRFKLHGGEPTLRGDFRELCAESQASGMITAAATNALIIPSRPRLLDYLDEVIISLDSPRPDINDRIRGRGSFQGAMETINLALRRGVRPYVNMVLTRLNFEDMEPMLEFCEARGIGMNAQPVVFSRGPYSDPVSELSLTAEENRALHRLLTAWKKQRRGLLFSAPSYRKVLDWPDYRVLTVASNGHSSCVAGRDYIRIEANGDVVPCCQYGADFMPKNIRYHGLDEALRHARTHNCGDCWIPYYTERKAIYGLRPSAIWNAIRRS